MNMKFTKTLLISLNLILASSIQSAAAPRPIAVDSRIKTLVYSGNEVFRIVIHYGYQTSIEFAEHEEVQTISMGNNFAWQVTPLDNRLFIKPLEESIITNMTVITNLRAYQFEVQSKSLSYAADEELVYVLRFFYPDSEHDEIKPEVEKSSVVESIAIPKPFNYNYSIKGPDKMAPIEIFDDGINTYFKFPNSVPRNAIRIQEAQSKSKGTELNVRYKGSYLYVNTVTKEFLILSGKESVSVFNEDYTGVGK